MVAHQLNISTGQAALMRALAIVAITLGLIVLTGWALDITAFKSVLPGLIVQKPNSALGVLLGGACLALLTVRDTRRLVGWGAGLLLVLGLATLAEYAFDWNPGFDQWLFHESINAHFTGNPGRMPVLSAEILTMLGGAFLLIHLRRNWVAIQLLALVSCLIALWQMGGYLFGDVQFQDMDGSTSLSLPSGLGFLVLSIGILAATVQYGLLAGKQRQLTTITIAVSLLMLLAAGVAVFHNMSQMRHAVTWVEHTYQVVTVSTDITSLSYKHQKLLRAFMAGEQERT